MVRSRVYRAYGRVVKRLKAAGRTSLRPLRIGFSSPLLEGPRFLRSVTLLLKFHIELHDETAACFSSGNDQTAEGSRF